MDTSIFLFFITIGYIEGKEAPIIVGGQKSLIGYINPLPTALMLTGIVVAVSVTACMLALTIKFNEIYGTIELNQIKAIRSVKHESDKNDATLNNSNSHDRRVFIANNQK